MKQKSKLTAAELAAVKIIEQWFLKKKTKRAITSKPEAKKVTQEDMDNLKYA